MIFFFIFFIPTIHIIIISEESDPNKWDFYLKRIFGAQINDGEYHKTGFTDKRIEKLLKVTGFENINIQRIDSHAQECLKILANKI